MIQNNNLISERFFLLLQVVLSNEDICYDYSCTTVCSLVSTVVCSVSDVAATVCCVPREPEYWWYDASCCLSRCTCTLFVLFVAL
jgi:hypothetical protein